MIKAKPIMTETGRRTYPLAYKLEFMAAWDECVGHGDKARLLRENGLDATTVHPWLKDRAVGKYNESLLGEALNSEPKRTHSQDRAELARFVAVNERLKVKLREAELAQEIMGKASELMKGIDLSSPDPLTSIPPLVMSQDQFDAWLARKRL